MDLGVLVVGLSGPSVKVLLPKFPGGCLVGPEYGPVGVGEFRPLVIPSMWVEGVAVPSLAVWVNKEVEFPLRFVRVGVGILLWPWVKLSWGSGGEGYRVGLIGGWEWKSPCRFWVSGSGAG